MDSPMGPIPKQPRPSPDPAEVERLVDNFLNKIKEMEKNQTYDARTITHLMAIRWDFEATRADLLKLAGG